MNISKLRNKYFTKDVSTRNLENEHTKYIKEINNWWNSLSEEDKMDVYDNMVDFLKWMSARSCTEGDE